MSPAPVGLVLSARPVANESSLYAPTFPTPRGNKTIQCVSLTTGYHGWGWRTDSDVVADLVKAGPNGGDMVYAATTIGDVYAFPAFPASERDPQPAWVTRLHAGVRKNLVLDGDDLGVVTSDNRLVCIDRITGEVRWAKYANVGEEASSAAQFSSKHAFYVCGGELRAYDRATGAPAWRLAGARQFVCERGARTILTDGGSRLWAVDTKSGAVLAEGEAPGWTFPSRAKPDATLLAVSDQGLLVGVEHGW
jgi:outer membrane protein assembly factor BamB